MFDSYESLDSVQSKWRLEVVWPVTKKNNEETSFLNSIKCVGGTLLFLNESDEIMNDADLIHMTYFQIYF